MAWRWTCSGLASRNSLDDYDMGVWKPNRRHLLAGATALVGARQIVAQSLETAAASAEGTSTAAAYDLAEGLTYLNHASIGTVPRAVREAHGRYLAICETNPWLYVWGGAWEEAFDRVHERSAAALGALVDQVAVVRNTTCLLYTSPSPRDRQKSRMPSSA